MGRSLFRRRSRRSITSRYLLISSSRLSIVSESEGSDSISLRNIIMGHGINYNETAHWMGMAVDPLRNLRQASGSDHFLQLSSRTMFTRTLRLRSGWRPAFIAGTHTRLYSISKTPPEAYLTPYGPSHPGVICLALNRPKTKNAISVQLLKVILQRRTIACGKLTR